jgi:hypothetical protein
MSKTISKFRRLSVIPNMINLFKWFLKYEIFGKYFDTQYITNSNILLVITIYFVINLITL